MQQFSETPPFFFFHLSSYRWLLSFLLLLQEWGQSSLALLNVREETRQLSAELLELTGRSRSAGRGDGGRVVTDDKSLLRRLEEVEQKVGSSFSLTGDPCVGVLCRLLLLLLSSKMNLMSVFLSRFLLCGIVISSDCYLLLLQGNNSTRCLNIVGLSITSQPASLRIVAFLAAKVKKEKKNERVFHARMT